MARSKVAEELQQIDAAAIAAMSPEGRLELAFELARRGVEMYMTAHHVDYETAARELKRAGRAGRRYSRCMDEDRPGTPCACARPSSVLESSSR